MYVDIGPSSFKSLFSHEHILHTFDDDHVQYAQLNNDKLFESQQIKNNPLPDGMYNYIIL